MSGGREGRAYRAVDGRQVYLPGWLSMWKCSTRSVAQCPLPRVEN